MNLSLLDLPDNESRTGSDSPRSEKYPNIYIKKIFLQPGKPHSNPFSGTFVLARSPLLIVTGDTFNIMTVAIITSPL